MAFLQHAPQDRNLEIVINCEGRDAGMMIPYLLPYSRGLRFASLQNRERF